MAVRKSETTYRIFRAAGGYAFLVAGTRGLKRSGLPRSTRAAALAIIEAEFPGAVQDNSLMPELVDNLRAFYRGEDVPLKARLDMSDLPAFSAQVYKALRRVRRGRVVTYGELAALCGSAGAARGVGGAMRRNPFPPLVPCHRVVGSNGALTGFSSEGGVDLKRRMLAAEGCDMERLG